MRIPTSSPRRCSRACSTASRRSSSHPALPHAGYLPVPPAPLVGNAYTQRLAAPRLPSDWASALTRFGASGFLREYFGERFVTLYELTRRGEMQDFNSRISALDYTWYLEQV